MKPFSFTTKYLLNYLLWIRCLMKVPQKLKKKLIFKDINQDSDLHDPEMCESYKHNHEWQHISAETLRYRINKTIAKFEVTGIYKDDLCQLLY